MMEIPQVLPMSARQQQIIAACVKIQQGVQLFTEGRIELEHLSGEKTGRKGGRTGGEDVTDAVKDLLKKPKRKKQKVVANKVSRKTIDARSERINDVADKIIALAKKDEWLTTQAIIKKLKASFYTVKRALGILKRRKDIKVVTKPGKPGSGQPNIPHDYWALA